MIDQFKLQEVDTQREFPLNQQEILVGRNKNCDINIKEANFSRQHARITLEADTVFIEDLASANGTFVNNQKISQKTTVSPGDVVTFASTQFFLIAVNQSSPTVLMKKLEIDDKNQQSSIVIRDGFSNCNETVIREYYPMPPGWSDFESDDFSPQAASYQCDPEIIDYLLAEKLPEKEKLASAALVIISGTRKSTVVGLCPQNLDQSWSIGRSDDCSLTFDDFSVSDQHAQLAVKDGQWKVTDCDSTNGILVNNKPEKSALLADRDCLAFGKEVMVFCQLIAS